ncbi:hypothetical protein KR018_010676 [Drosophila ironensis]|nr:hypothetical protein KR018_010676 [Drosophila ironensis]
MSWLSVQGIILLPLAILVTWALPPMWDNLPLNLSEDYNVTNQWRIDEAWKATISVDIQLHEFYYKELNNRAKDHAKHIMKSANDEVNKCVSFFYTGSTLERFLDCMRHVLSRHMTQMSNLKANSNVKEAMVNGGSRLKIWH